MSVFVRSKRVTHPLDDKAKARLVGCGGQLSYVSSGSEHSAAEYYDGDDSPCLSQLVHCFLEEEEEDQRNDPDTHQPSSLGYESDSDRVDSVADTPDLMIEDDVLRCTAGVGHSDPYRNLLLAHVLKAMEALSSFKNQKPVFRRKVMSFLRELGHNAAICKTKWDSSGGLTAGGYEFIDVVVLQTSQRYVLDLEFASQFEIARPTSQYQKLSQLLPRVFVGKGDDLKRIVKVMCDAARRSLRSRDLSIPPWRKNRYMQNKWFGPYRRTTNPVAAAASSVGMQAVNGVKCRCVGFDDGLSGRLFVRTR
ncbi:hypothetical protein Tsubulata_025782 [Turnera subulata]|uniref:DUF506 domain-containing protein n=1 Tax=Turnera subulata TaxID=218843 RepID=A0A9Q0J6G6_9ROSI|nr:hypothetical protein Tsubulata_025782 [Turnera subulata]